MDLVVWLLLLYLGLGAILFVLQRSFIYFPTKAFPHAESEVTFNNDGEVIKAIVLNPGKAEAIIYFGGNAETVLFNAEAFKPGFPEHSIYLVNYRGYGGSTGTPQEKALYADALHIFDQVSQSFSQVSIIGRSLGSGVATYVAARRDVGKLVLVTPFDSVESIAQKQFPIYPMSILLRDKFRSDARAKDIKSEVLVLIAGDDEVIPREHTDNLINAFGDNPVSAEIFERAGHNTISEHTGYHRLIKAFIENGDV